MPLLLHAGPAGSVLAGFLHPLLGLDHLLAMVTVGLLSAQIGGKAIWTIPTTFVSIMAIGGILGLLGIPLPAVELGIALSVIVLGLTLFIKRDLPTSLILVVVALFASLHGHAHGAEVPSLADGFLLIFAYVVGFLVSTTGLHIIGALLGIIATRSTRGATVLRWSGVAIALIGAGLVRSLL